MKRDVRNPIVRCARCRRLLGGWLPVVLAIGAIAAGGDGDPADDPISATVDGQPIYRRELDRAVERALSGRSAEADGLDALRRQTLTQLIDRRLALKYLEDNDLGASPQEIDRQVRRVTGALQAQNVELDEYLRKSNLTLDELQRRAAWDIGWQRFLDEHLTDENLARYFQQHQRDFDGTRMVVAHILFRVAPPGDRQAVDRAVDQAAEVRRRIQDGELAFDDAARQYSTAPTAADGGRVGPIGRREPMPEAFSRAAFALDEGEMSGPVVSPFGVHLIRRQGMEPGRLTWQEVRAALESAVVRHLFRWAADQQRPHAVIQILEGG